MAEEAMVSFAVDNVINICRQIRKQWNEKFEPRHQRAALPYIAIPSEAIAGDKIAAHHRNLDIYEAVIQGISDKQKKLTKYPHTLVSPTVVTQGMENGQRITREYNQVGVFGYLVRDTVLGDYDIPSDFYAYFEFPGEAVITNGSLELSFISE